MQMKLLQGGQLAKKECKQAEGMSIGCLLNEAITRLNKGTVPPSSPDAFPNDSPHNAVSAKSNACPADSMPHLVNNLS